MDDVEQPAQSPTGPAVLVVDDEEELRAMLDVVLRSSGFRVELAASGEEALARIEKEPAFDVVVLDHRMPRMTGAEVAQRLRAAEYAAPIVLFTAYLEPALREECSRLDVLCVDKLDWPLLVDACRRLAPAA